MDKKRCRGESIGMETLETLEGEKSKHAHTLTQIELAILTAKPSVEPDRSKIKWRKVKKWKLPKTERTAHPKRKHHPGTKRAREVLAFEGRALHRCEACGVENEHLPIHHIDGNAYNNKVSNLMVLCQPCHARRHNISDLEGVKEWYYGTKLDY